MFYPIPGCAEVRRRGITIEAANREPFTLMIVRFGSGNVNTVFFDIVATQLETIEVGKQRENLSKLIFPWGLIR